MMDMNHVKSHLQSVNTGSIETRLIEEFAYAVEDYNKVHLNREFAISAGFRDIIAHGPLTMAYMSKLLMQVFPPEQIKELETEFHLPTYTGDTLTVRCDDIIETENGIRCTLSAINQDGKITTTGIAIIEASRINQRSADI